MSGNDIPGIDVRISDLSYNVKVITELLYEESTIKNRSLPFRERVLKAIPELIQYNLNDMSYSEIYIKIEKILQVHYCEYMKYMEEREAELKQILNLFLPPVIREMLELFHIKWPNEQKVIKCYIGLYPVFPRDVICKEYWMHYKAPLELVKKASVHEINHFVLFEKWKSMHGYTRNEQPLHPEGLWFLEEMAVDPTLNCSRMQKVSPYDQKAYAKFYDCEINGIRIQDYINQYYSDSTSIEEFLNSSYEFIQKNHKYIIEYCG